MHIVKIDLPIDVQKVEVHAIADTHTGDPHADLKLIKERINHIEQTPNAYAILNGDLLNNATITSVSDVYGEVMTPEAQVEYMVDLLYPIRHKIWCVNPGNHESRTYRKEGVDLTRMLARELGIIDKFSKASTLIFVRFGKNAKQRKMVYTIYANHGSGGGRKAGAKAARLEDMAGIVDADIYIHSHTHLPMVMRQAYYRVNMQNSSIAWADKLFVNTGAALDYGGYGEVFEFKPSSKETPVIYLWGNEKRMKAEL
jgi:predicted phosphodiesterase